MKRFVATILLLLSFGNSPLKAEDLASAPYLHIRYAYEAKSLKNKGIRNLDVHLRVTSRNPDLKDNELQIWLDNRGERTDIAIADDGTFELPEVPSEDMEAAWIRSNQPKGTLSFSATFHVKMNPPKGKIVENALVIRYNQLFAGNTLGTDLADELLDSGIGTDSKFSGSELSAIVFSLGDSDESSRVAIKTGSSTIDIRPFGRKSYRIPFDAKLSDDPSVVILVPNSGWKCKVEIAPRK
ncbi:hypothetical protein [Rhodopirellula europaea]|uniref:hypothetical protein n=1 Tax=Rhodopirellula europaea TaxID=1263866 RepID=UPI003D2939F5